MGSFSSRELEDHGERNQYFEIAADEQLIGCELDTGSDGNLCGVTWLKWKTINWTRILINCV